MGTLGWQVSRFMYTTHVVLLLTCITLSLEPISTQAEPELNTEVNHKPDQTLEPNSKQT